MYCQSARMKGIQRIIDEANNDLVERGLYW
jgi:hypothetical protein